MAGIDEIAAEHIQGGLRCVPANAFAVARKTKDAVTRAVRIRQRNVNQSDRFFRGATGWAGDSRDADAKRRANAAADALGEGLRDFGADGAFGLDELGGHVGPGSFQVIAVTNHSTQKV